MTTDTRPWNIESSYYVAPRSQVRTQFDGLTLQKIKPVRAWGGYFLNALGWSGLIALLAVWLLGRW